MRKNGSLIVAGTGLKLGQITMETMSIIKSSDRVLYLVADPVTERWINRESKDSESLQSCYSENKDRIDSYNEMVLKILDNVRNGLRICVLFYGHPGIFVNPSHEAIRLAKSEGYDARMLPGISAEDCLFADLGVDPSTTGCQSFEATDFLLYRRGFDIRSKLILWQVGVIGNFKFNVKIQDKSKVSLLCDTLINYYPIDHEITIYEASQLAICEPRIHVTTIRELPNETLTPISTLYIPECIPSIPESDIAINLGIEKSLISYKTCSS